MARNIVLPAVASIITLALSCVPGLAAAKPLPAAIAAPGLKVIRKLQAYGEQIYDCKKADDGKLAWTFREPLATLLDTRGATVGRHFAGPRWMLDDGSIITGAVEAKAPGASKNDVAWLKLKVTKHEGHGALSGVQIVQRIDVHGGNLTSNCATAGQLELVPYQAVYVFLGH